MPQEDDWVRALSRRAEQLYIHLTQSPRLPDDQESTRAALEELRRCGLVTEHPDEPGSFIARDPAGYAQSWVDGLTKTITTLLERAAQMPLDLAGLAEDAEQAAWTANEYTDIRPLRGLPEIQTAINEAVDVAEVELLTAQPHGPRPYATLEEIGDYNLDAARRGVSVRTLYQTSVRQHPLMREWVARFTGVGAQVRTVPEVMTRMVIVDRKVAFLPSSDQAAVLAERERSRATPSGYVTALQVRNPLLVAHFADLFDVSWGQGAPWDGQATGDSTAAELDRQDEAILTYLDQELTVEAIAVRLGVSTRTAQTYLKRLRLKLGADSPYALGRRRQQMLAERIGQGADSDPTAGA